jgi:hypothetical protein
MTRRAVRHLLAIGLVLVLAAACQQKPELVLSKKGAVELRAIQSRAFDTGDQVKTMRSIVATMQDMGYSIEKIEPKAGTVTGSKLTILRLTASCYPRNETQTIVRANAIVTIAAQNLNNQVDSPEFYQKLFFEPLSKAMFLDALAVADGDSLEPASTGVAPASAAVPAPDQAAAQTPAPTPEKQAP